MPIPLLRLLLLLMCLSGMLVGLLYLTISPSFPVTAHPSLFPTSAIISLAGDNGTFFLSRPAAFGPSLPKTGLTGQLYALEETELACEDVPGNNDDPSTFAGEGGERGMLSWHVTDSYDRAGSDAGRHADIETLQESAEIEGKIVLITRGGCGFFEKVMWSQRRGAVAVIVGDNEAHRPLLTMYAKGDTSNISIPAIFTSWQTSHMLTSLLPKNIHPNQPQRQHNLLPASPTTSALPTTTYLSKVASLFKKPFAPKDPQSSMSANVKPDFYSPLAVEQPVDDDKSVKMKTKPVPIAAKTLLALPTKTPGIDNTHRPPMSGELSYQIIPEDAHSPPTALNPNSQSKLNPAYGPHDESGARIAPGAIAFEGNGWIGVAKTGNGKGGKKDKEPDMSEGLWITLTPTRINSSPFIDTLLVLVVSPLVTLTVVYSLLLMRSRYRRRRWRAPASVVSQLPVHTYHTPLPSPRIAPTNPPAHEKRNSTASIPPYTISPSSTSSTPTRPVVFRYFPPSRECVVCLEEYVSNVSQVMRLPCGHEFHVECITPWLVTRRRTCPICKKCVVAGLGLEAASIGTGSSSGSSSSLAVDGGLFTPWVERMRRFFWTGRQRERRRVGETTPLMNGDGEIEDGRGGEGRSV